MMHTRPDDLSRTSTTYMHIISAVYIVEFEKITLIYLEENVHENAYDRVPIYYNMRQNNVTV